MGMSVGVLDHYNVSTRKLQETVQFYENVLGLVNGPRPPFNFPGAWLYSEGHPVLHLNDLSPTDKQQRPDSGVIDHIAFGSRGFEQMKRHLTSKGVPFRVNQVPNSRRWQIFVEDPNNVLIELNFDAANETPAARLKQRQSDRLKLAVMRPAALHFSAAADRWLRSNSRMTKQEAAARTHTLARLGYQDHATAPPARSVRHLPQ